jgi:hypothetical protein
MNHCTNRVTPFDFAQGDAVSFFPRLDKNLFVSLSVAEDCPKPVTPLDFAQGDAGACLLA